MNKVNGTNHFEFIDDQLFAVVERNVIPISSVVRCETVQLRDEVAVWIARMVGSAQIRDF